MGKVLVLRGTDFSENAVDKVVIDNFIPTALSYQCAYYMDYQNVSAIRQTTETSAAGLKVRLFVADVSNYVGRQIDITAANDVVTGAYYGCFASDLGTFTMEEIATLGAAPSFTTTNITTLETFNISTVSGVKKTVRKTIPAGAKYLCVGVMISEGFNTDELNVALV